MGRGAGPNREGQPGLSVGEERRELGRCHAGRARGLGRLGRWAGSRGEEGRRERVGPPSWVPFFYSFLIFSFSFPNYTQTI